MSKQRCGYIALIGAPNAGKSTLLNQLVGSKVSIVTPKVQTTRTIINGICIEGDAQLIFIDTPGIFRPEKRLEKAMVKAAWTGVKDADIVALLVDVQKGIGKQTHEIIEALKQRKTKNILILNKIDLVSPELLLGLSKQLNDLLPFERTFMVSALTGEGVPDIKKYLEKEMPEGPWLFPEDDLTDMPKRFLASEMTREQLFLRLEKELPYALSVDTEQWEDMEDGSVKIHQVIYVQKQNHKMIVVGKGGSMIKEIGAKARKELEQLLGTTVHLFLFVKVRENWTDNPQMYHHMRLEWVK